MKLDTRDKTVSLRSKWSDLGVYTDEPDASNLRHPLLWVGLFRPFWLQVIENLIQADLNNGGHWATWCWGRKAQQGLCGCLAVSPESRFHPRSPACLSRVVWTLRLASLWPQDDCQQLLGIYDSSCLWEVLMLHKLRVHHSWNLHRHDTNATSKILSTHFGWFHTTTQFSDTKWISYSSA